MSNLEPIFSIAQTREIEEYLQKQEGIPGEILMQNAAKALLDSIIKNNSNLSREIIIFCGAGNNGGDGFLLAEMLKTITNSIKVIKVGNFSHQSDLGKKSENRALKAGLEIVFYQKDTIKYSNDCIIVDAILGIGLQGSIKSQQLEAIEEINNFRKNHSNSLVIAVDIASGLCADSGKILSQAVCADITVTFLTLKAGLFIEEGKIYSGQVEFSNLRLNYKDFLSTMTPLWFKLNSTYLYDFIPRRKADANKGDFGHVLIAGGNYNMGGSVIMAAEAAFRMGAGKVTVLSRKENFFPLLARLPNVMTCEVNNKNDLKKVIEGKTVIAIGMGLGINQDENSDFNWAKELFNFFLKSDLPKVIDADALNMLSKSEDISDYKLENAILTPHPTEAARLLNFTTNQVQFKRSFAIAKLHEKYKATVILKGNNSLILGEEKKLCLCPYGNPGMATAGMGDVLSGIIAGLLAQKLEPYQAACLSTYIHAKAGDLAATRKSQIGLMATDLADYLFRFLGFNTI